MKQNSLSNEFCGEPGSIYLYSKDSIGLFHSRNIIVPQGAGIGTLPLAGCQKFIEPDLSLRSV